MYIPVWRLPLHQAHNLQDAMRACALVLACLLAGCMLRVCLFVFVCVLYTRALAFRCERVFARFYVCLCVCMYTGERVNS